MKNKIKFINKMLELGAELELSCSRSESEKIKEKAFKLYNKHIKSKSFRKRISNILKAALYSDYLFEIERYPDNSVCGFNGKKVVDFVKQRI